MPKPGLLLRVKNYGRCVMAYALAPFFAETCYGGRNIFYHAGYNLYVVKNAIYSVACLEWGIGDYRTHLGMANAKMRSLYETLSCKRG